jgi:two-component system response regulator NreC
MGGYASLRILVADDHALVREGLTRLIDDQPDMSVVAQAGDGLAAIQLAQDFAPDVALVDVSMPGLDGTRVTRFLKANCPQVKVIAVTRHDDGSVVRRLLDAGAAGYVLKQSASADLIRAIQLVAAGGTYVDRAIRGIAPAPSEAPGTPPPSSDPPLTTEEEGVLRLVASAHSNEEIARTLSMDMGDVIVVRAAAMAKARLSSRGAVVRYAEARGWLRGA